MINYGFKPEKTAENRLALLWTVNLVPIRGQKVSKGTLSLCRLTMSGMRSTGRLLVRAPNAIGRVMEDAGFCDKKTDVLSMTKRRGGALIIAPEVGKTVAPQE
jgi:hypothetical protein